MRRDFLILFLLPVVSMSQTENSLSTNACEAGAEIRSMATSGMTEPLSRCCQNSAEVCSALLGRSIVYCARQFIIVLLEEVTATPVVLSASLAARCGNADETTGSAIVVQ